MRSLDLGSVCQRVRFSLDEPTGCAVEPDHRAVAEFVARVRAGGLQVTPTTVPRVASTVERVCRRVGLYELAETYIISDPACNAFVPVGASRARPIVVLTSGLVTLLDINEIAFAVGHELGHFGFQHGALEQREEAETELEALNRRSKQRYAEVSADRVGLLATGSVFVAARVMVKLASGLPAELLGLDVDAFIKQAEREPEEFSRAWELDASHPSLPLRMWALTQFARSATFAELSGQGRGGRTHSEVDREIEARMAEIGDGRISEIEAKVYEAALIWASAALVVEDGRVTRVEHEALACLVGKERAVKALQYAKSNGRAGVIAKLVGALERLNGASLTTRRRFDEALSAFSLAIPGRGQSQASLVSRTIRDTLRLT